MALAAGPSAIASVLTRWRLASNRSFMATIFSLIHRDGVEFISVSIQSLEISFAAISIGVPTKSPES